MDSKNRVTSWSEFIPGLRYKDVSKRSNKHRGTTYTCIDSMCAQRKAALMTKDGYIRIIHSFDLRFELLDPIPEGTKHEHFIPPITFVNKPKLTSKAQPSFVAGPNIPTQAKPAVQEEIDEAFQARRVEVPRTMNARQYREQFIESQGD